MACSLFPRTLLLLSLAGCYPSERYLIADADAERLAGLAPPARATTLLPARRKENGREVLLRAATITTVGPSAPAGGGERLVVARAYNPMVTAASLLTWIGTGISLVASTIFFSTRLDLAQPLGLGSAIAALSAEPPMIVGTTLWLIGLSRYRPQEAPRAGDTVARPPEPIARPAR